MTATENIGLTGPSLTNGPMDTALQADLAQLCHYTQPSSCYYLGLLPAMHSSTLAAALK